jgi:hypothetical protein
MGEIWKFEKLKIGKVGKIGNFTFNFPIVKSTNYSSEPVPALLGSAPSRSNINPKRIVLDKGFLVIPEPDGIRYEKFKPSILYFNPTPIVKYCLPP